MPHSQLLYTTMHTVDYFKSHEIKFINAGTMQFANNENIKTV